MSIQLFVGGIMILVIIMAIIGFDGSSIDRAIQWVIPLGLSFILSSFVGTIIESFGGGVLKTITLTIPIGKFGISISIFAVAVFLIKIWWF